MHQPISIALLFFFSFFTLLWLNRARARSALNLPPSPPKFPIIGHIHHLGALPHRSLQALSTKYGPLMLLQLGQTPTLVVQSAEMAKQISKTNDIIFANRPITTASKAFLYGCKDIAFAPYGDYWRQMRKICVLDLLSAKRVQSFRFIREEEIGNMVNKIKKSCSEKKEVNLSDMIITVTNNVISRVALSKSLEIESGKTVYAKTIEELMELFGRFSVEDMFPSLGWIDVLTSLDRKMKNTSRAMHLFLDEVIEEHLMARKDGDRHVDCRDFVDILLDCEQDSTLGVEFTRENLKGVLLNMFVAGTDTTYTTLEWIMAELVNHPDVMKQLQEEIRSVVGTKSKVEEHEIIHMDYLNCVIKETLRLHAPIPFLLPRLSSESTTIDGYNIPAKTRVIINVWAIARDPKIWDKPEDFIPERFVNNSIDYRGLDFAFIPFGAGRRICPGISFGINSVEAILVNLLYWFDWEKKAIDMSEGFGLSAKLKFPLRLLPISQT
ncbi:hypothetical protein ACHQM5_010891 [Ranunculus cassubicifolius]